MRRSSACSSEERSDKEKGAETGQDQDVNLTNARGMHALLLQDAEQLAAYKSLDNQLK